MEHLAFDLFPRHELAYLADVVAGRPAVRPAAGLGEGEDLPVEEIRRVLRAAPVAVLRLLGLRDIFPPPSGWSDEAEARYNALYVGKRYGALVVERYAGAYGRAAKPRNQVIAVCDCGVLWKGRPAELTSGRVRDCGCQRRGRTQ